MSEQSVLLLGAELVPRAIPEPEALLLAYREYTGCDYLDYTPVTSPDDVFPEDLAVTLAVNSQARWQAFRSLKDNSSTIVLKQLPDKELAETTEQERQSLAEFIAGVASLPGFAASLATKVLHKKRPGLIPVLDNQAIFGAYLNPDWPDKPASSFSVKSQEWIKQALDCIAFDLKRAENRKIWQQLHKLEANRTTLQLFDSVWWMYFRKAQPIIG